MTTSKLQQLAQHNKLVQQNKDAAWERLLMIQAQLASMPDSVTLVQKTIAKLSTTNKEN